MSGKGKKYTFWLHPGDPEHTICIGKLDGILGQINKGEVKKGTLSKEIARALHMYFTGQVGDSAGLQASAKSTKIIQQEVDPLLESAGGKLIERESSMSRETASDSAEADNIKSSLIHLTMSLQE